VVLARVLLLLAVIVWGWTFVATKVCLEHLDPFSLLGARFLIALPVLRVLMLIRGIRFELGGHRRSLFLASGIFLAHFTLQVTGLMYTSATHTGWIIAITPLVLALLARLVLGERIGRHTVAGIVVATFGILLLVSRGDLRGLDWISSAGDVLVLASAHTWALYTIAIRNPSRSRHPLAVTLAVLLPATVVLVALALVRFDLAVWRALPGEAWFALLFLGVLGTALAHWFWQEGVARIGAARAGTFLYLEPLATTALAVPYLGEPLTMATVAGGSLVLAGVWLSHRRLEPE
jgi:drug/metabolite transporter (DMT)-like permease